MCIYRLLQRLLVLSVCLLAHKLVFAAPPPPCRIDDPSPPQVSLSVHGSEKLPLPLCRLAPDTWLLTGAIAQLDTRNRGWMGNAGFIITPEGVVVIDALGTPRLGHRLIATIRSVTGLPIRYLIITHNHPDHSYGASAFLSLPNVTVITHSGSRDYLDSSEFAASVDYRRGLLGEDMEGFTTVKPDLVIAEPLFTARRITLGGKRFDLYNAGRHHSWGDLVVHQVDGDIVWISDLAFNGRTTFMADGHSREALEGIDWLKRTFPQANLMVPGHGNPQHAPFPMLEHTRSYIERLREKMGSAVKQGIDMQEAIGGAELNDWRHVPLYRENHRANAQFIYQEMEQELF